MSFASGMVDLTPRTVRVSASGLMVYRITWLVQAHLASTLIASRLHTAFLVT